jgi:hypothetical protein
LIGGLRNNDFHEYEGNIVLKETGALIIAVVTSSVIFAATPTTIPKRPSAQPTEVKIISVPIAHPQEVKIVSTPPAQPTEVKLISTPPAQPTEVKVISEDYAALATAVFTGALVLVTLLIGAKQTRDSGRAAKAASESARAANDSINLATVTARASMQREVNRAAHKAMAQAERLEQLAEKIPPARQHLSVLLHQGGMPPQVKEDIETALEARKTRMEDMKAQADSFAFDGLESAEAGELTRRLWRLDQFLAQLEEIEADILGELNEYNSESQTIRMQNTAMQAAALNANLSRPPGAG